MSSRLDLGTQQISCHDIPVQVDLHPSAFKHGLSAADIRQAWKAGEHRQVWLEDDQPARLLRVGTDMAGRPIELVALVFDQERILIIHAMKARKKSIDATKGG
ncbi:MAG TPA: toxin [Phycicoccus sp.]|nr:toxin [Phycicoccus sp.]HQK32114.1 toxin [Phycicoccus sp.]